MVTGFVSRGVSGRFVALTTHHLVVPRREWVEPYLCLAFVPAWHVTGKLYLLPPN
jgi:hypothetical protein